ncbi:MAG: hypothetical protein EAZ71_11790 [Verrucomicrobia bacterium]|nr:MAG: hypothetical protein EAZ82_11235 [Verrucomicrobiota bacterium]TAF23945.1 MAG: hypothetical protein EAZ71_11790 [Verrucomicrobiota bacterium]
MHPILQRLLYGLVILFLATQALTIGLLFYTDHPILIPKWRAIAGLLALLAVTAAVFRKNDKGIIDEGLVALGFCLAFISMFFEGSHPMHQYAAVRHVTADGFIESDEVYRRSAPVVRMLESEGSRVSKTGGSFSIERYLYSPRIGILLGKSLGEGKGSPDMGYETFGVSAWLFGIRVACEEFVFFAINLSPLLFAYGLYCQWKSKPLKDSLAIEPIKALFLTGPFAIGLIPLIGT